MLPTLTVLTGLTLVLVGGPILTPASNPALPGVNLEVVGGTTLVSEIGRVCERRKLRVNVGKSKVMRCSRNGNRD